MSSEVVIPLLASAVGAAGMFFVNKLVRTYTRRREFEDPDVVRPLGLWRRFRHADMHRVKAEYTSSTHQPLVAMRSPRELSLCHARSM